MRPNTLDGQTLQVNREIETVQEALLYYGDIDLAQTLVGQINSRRDNVLRAHPEWDHANVSDTMVLMLAEDDYEAAHISHEATLAMDSDQTSVVVDALKLLAKRRSPVEKPFRKSARLMLKHLDTK